MNIGTTKLMSFILRIFLLAICFTLVVECNVFAKGYTVSSSTQVRKKDYDWAKEQALEKVQTKLILKAAQNMLSQENLAKLQKNFPTYIRVPQRYIQSFSILSEEITKSNINLSVYSEVNIPALAAKLKNLGFILKSDPFFSVTFLVSKQLEFNATDFLAQLKKMHIVAQKPSFLNPEFLSQPKQKFISSVFQTFSQNNTIYLLSPVIKNNQIVSLRFTIYTKIHSKIIASWKYPITPVDVNQKTPELTASIAKFLQSLDYSYLHTQAYQSNATDLFLSVTGLDSPFLRAKFERYFLKSNPLIKKYSLNQLAPKKTTYLLSSLSSTPKILNSFYHLQTHAHFALAFNKSNASYIEVKTEYKARTHRATPVQGWQNPSIFTKLSQSTLASITATPTKQESEPNNSPFSYNALPASTWVWGNVRSRSDNDIYQIKLPQNKSKQRLIIHFQVLGQTHFSPVLYLYQNDFQWLQTYKPIKIHIGNAKTTIKRTFTTLPQSIYIRITDYIGYIPQEIGGFLSFQYIIYYTWT